MPLPLTITIYYLRDWVSMHGCSGAGLPRPWAARPKRGSFLRAMVEIEVLPAHWMHLFIFIFIFTFICVKMMNPKIVPPIGDGLDFF